MQKSLATCWLVSLQHGSQRWGRGKNGTKIAPATATRCRALRGATVPPGGVCPIAAPRGHRERAAGGDTLKAVMEGQGLLLVPPRDGIPIPRCARRAGSGPAWGEGCSSPGSLRHPQQCPPLGMGMPVLGTTRMVAASLGDNKDASVMPYGAGTVPGTPHTSSLCRASSHPLHFTPVLGTPTGLGSHHGGSCVPIVTSCILPVGRCSPHG